ncbi:MAG: DUF2911 domain-containing protein [Flavobacteriaceae bacterium]
MKKFIYLFALLTGTALVAQVQTPQPSPAANIQQTVGLTEVTLNYSRPSMRGREIVGNLVSFGSLWRTGANKNTTISFSDPVTVGGQGLAAGTYAIFTRPGESMWEVFFYTDSENWGVPSEWDAQKIAATVEVTPKETQPMESFSIWLSDLTNNDAVLNMAWETTKISLALEVPTVKKAMASIKKVLANNPKDRDYYSSAVYYLQEGQDLPQAKKWINKAISMNDEPYWYFRQQSLILAALNEKEAAVAAAKKSLERAEKAGNWDYVKMNKTSIAEWTK